MTQKSYGTSLSLPFLIRGTGMITAPTPQGYCEDFKRSERKSQVCLKVESKVSLEMLLHMQISRCHTYPLKQTLLRIFLCAGKSKKD